MAIHSEQLVNVGVPTGRLLGRGVEPRFFELPDSKLIFGMELLMDATDAVAPRDAYHDHVELLVEPTLDEIRERLLAADSYSPEFLLSHDPLMAAVRDDRGVDARVGTGD